MKTSILSKILGTFLVLLVGSVVVNISLSMMNEHDTFSFIVAATVTIAVILGVIKLLWELWFKKE